MPSAPGVEAPRRIVDALRYVGPGLILTAGIVGTGELVLTPRVAAEHGFSLLWLIVLGCVVKVFVQIELGRYAVATGQTTLQALNSLPGPRWRASWMLWLWLPVFIAMISVVGGILGGTAHVIRLLGVEADPRVLTVLLGVSCAILLGLGRYRLIELCCTALVAVFMVATAVAVVALQWTEYRVTSAQIASGFRFTLPANFATAFAAFGIIGVGAAELLYYPYWCLEKGYAQRVGPRTEQDVGWLDRARGWLRVMRVDAWSSMIVYTAATVAFYVLGAAVLHRKGLVVSNQEMIPTLAQMYSETYGAGGLVVFLVGALATLYSTAFAASASNGRLLADALGLFGLARATPGVTGRDERVRWCSVALPLYAALLYLVWPQPVTLILISGVGQAILLPFLGGAALFFLYRRLDPAVRPGRVWTCM
ncbi:MAG TPA: Nramp family divalent metal transporter, partial [Candidatus Synoicihabitans sp.]|nr:Nramp family divalent metal transporter [Candidatus Synoicihabitans sp.]